MQRKKFKEYAILKAAVTKYQEEHPDYEEFSCPMISLYIHSVGGDCSLFDAAIKTYILEHKREYLDGRNPKMTLSSPIFLSIISFEEERSESEVRKEWLGWLELYCNSQMQKYADKHPIDAFILGWFYKY